jgi:hypothetical protein
VGVDGRGRGEAHGLPDLAHRRRVAVLRAVPLDELEDLLLALRHLEVNHQALSSWPMKRVLDGIANTRS